MNITTGFNEKFNALASTLCMALWERRNHNPGNSTAAATLIISWQKPGEYYTQVACYQPY